MQRLKQAFPLFVLALETGEDELEEGLMTEQGSALVSQTLLLHFAFRRPNDVSLFKNLARRFQNFSLHLEMRRNEFMR